VIAHNIYAQCDEEGNHFNLMDGVVDHRTDGHGVARADMYINHGINKQAFLRIPRRSTPWKWMSMP
jgi:hypothetical protein